MCAIVPLSGLAGAGPAVAADGRGPGQAVWIGGAADGFAIPGKDAIYDSPVNIVPSTRYPGTVRIEIPGNGCLATNTKSHLQWTKCNDDASKNWLVEPLDTAGDALGRTDNTLAEANVRPGSEHPRFILRSWKYPDRCVTSPRHGVFDPRMMFGKGQTATCTAADTATDARLQFAVVAGGHQKLAPGAEEWEFLRSQMVAGALALGSRSAGSGFAGDNLWVKPYDAEGNPVGVATQASADGYYQPRAVIIDPRRRSSIVSQAAVTKDCSVGGMWWNLRNDSHDTVRLSVGVDQQRTDEFSWGLNGSVSLEKEWAASGMKVGVSIGGHVDWSSSTATTKSQSVDMPIAPGKYGLVVISAPAISLTADWKSGTALQRPWNVAGAFAVATKDAQGYAASSAHWLNSTEQKSCLAQPAGKVKDGAPFRVVLPEGRLAPVVGDTVSADVTFVVPQPDPANPIDVRYQWYADDKPIVGQVASTYTVTNDTVGRELSFAAFENGGLMRFESVVGTSLPTAPVERTPALLSADVPASARTAALPDAIAGRPYDVALNAVVGIADDLTVDDAQLPPGVTFDVATGTLRGTPAAVGTWEVSLRHDDGDQIDATLRVDPAPTVFPATVGLMTQVGREVEVPLVDSAGTDATYEVEFATPDGTRTDVPAGLTVVVAPDGALSLRGVPAVGGEHHVRVIERSPHPAAGDARPTDFQLVVHVDDSASIIVRDGDRVTLPIGVAGSVPVASTPAGAAPVTVEGHLPAGTAYDADAGALTGTPTVVGEYPLTVTDDEGRRVSFVLETFGAPVIEVEAPATVVVGEPATWLVRAPHAEDLTAAVTAAGDVSAPSWATMSEPAAGELDVDAVPATAGDYEIVVTARNAAGTTTRTVPFTVVSSSSTPGDTDAPGGDTAPGDGAAAPGTGSATDTGAADDRLPRTGGAPVGPLVAASVLLAGLGAALIAVRRTRRARAATTAEGNGVGHPDA